ncbi:hypothetical protein VFPPC_17546 [Pochonia chlamydosporia 170]|uniref:Uncharacterized protein n=1 Tax=Pochonia chlamydosporia 170 TaxID=1380566 RepID=A0A219AR99_METCM|nr:hypothetical protein VFPPC_17546 [Pochonia chlamydosporia 170]OWT43291.1 hypothetical protein VFPPC_17546 [Pochonia chlamydosporia 170]
MCQTRKCINDQTLDVWLDSALFFVGDKVLVILLLRQWEDALANVSSLHMAAGLP